MRRLRLPGIDAARKIGIEVSPRVFSIADEVIE
jgi:hypothetical protein